MLLLREPTTTVIDSFLSAQRAEAYSYADIGASRGHAPRGFNVDHNRVLLGSGEKSFAQAVAAIRSWQMFNVGWCRLYPPHAPVQVGTTVAVLVRHFGFWSLNACRIVHLLEERGAVHKYGFAYGTLAQHSEMGEERFSVEWHREDESVWYDLYAFSRPRHPLARLGYPVSRMLQKRFARDSKMAMVRAVSQDSGDRNLTRVRL